MTLVLDDDVAVQLQQLQRDRGTTLRQVVNDVLRQGLRELSRAPQLRPRFRTSTVSLGRCFLSHLDDVVEVLDARQNRQFL